MPFTSIVVIVDNMVTFFVVFTRRADQKLTQRTSPPIVSSTGNLFYPYVVTCAFLFISITFSCLYRLYYVLFFHMSSALTQRQLSQGPWQRQLIACSELAQAQHQFRFSSLAVGAQ